MGWSSYVEDILNRFLDNIRDVEAKLSRGNTPTARDKWEIEKTRILLEDLREELLEVWTNPELDEAKTIVALKSELKVRDLTIRDLEKEVRGLKESCKPEVKKALSTQKEKFENRELELMQQCSELAAERDEWKKMFKDCQRELVRRDGLDPGTFGDEELFQ